MKILLLGKNGQVGWELQRALAPLGTLIALDRTALDRTALDRTTLDWTGSLQRLCGDLTNLTGLIATIEQLKPNVVVNAAAYTAVDKAESEPLLATQINREAVAALAKTCAQINAILVHYSTDYVFNGAGHTAWTEDDASHPLNVYGQTKRAGELAILQSGCDALIFRTSWVYATRGSNFIKTMLRLAQEREQLNIINDQTGAPTSAALIADVTAHALKAYAEKIYAEKSYSEKTFTGKTDTEKTASLSGIYHLTAAGEVSWYDYASFIFEQARAHGVALKLQQVNAIATSAYVTPALRPLNSRLNLSKIQRTFHLTLPDWQQGVVHTLQELIEENIGK
ncbi:MAG: dTDP-4-dehydrorhamnose reductase [Sphingobacteriales bacterium]|nr:MAG: dTDP-4-dehydrorhamnose reductase [Sphingobacteriales bacterium]